MSPFRKWAVWVTSFLTVATGVGYFVTKYLVSTPDPYAVVNHPWQPWFLKAHIVVSPLLVFALGTVAVDHVWDHFVSGVQVSRRTAVVTAATVVPMVLTGYLIQVFTGAGWVRAMAWSHMGFGAVYAVTLTAHNVIVQRVLGGSGGGAPADPEAPGAAAGPDDGDGAPAHREAPTASAGPDDGDRAARSAPTPAGEEPPPRRGETSGAPPA